MEGGHDDPVAKDLGDPEKGPARDLSAIEGDTIPTAGKCLVRMITLDEDGQLAENDLRMLCTYRKFFTRFPNLALYKWNSSGSYKPYGS